MTKRDSPPNRTAPAAFAASALFAAAYGVSVAAGPGGAMAFGARGEALSLLAAAVLFSAGVLSLEAARNRSAATTSPQSATHQGRTRNDQEPPRA